MGPGATGQGPRTRWGQGPDGTSQGLGARCSQGARGSGRLYEGPKNENWVQEPGGTRGQGRGPRSPETGDKDPRSPGTGDRGPKSPGMFELFYSDKGRLLWMNR